MSRPIVYSKTFVNIECEIDQFKRMSPDEKKLKLIEIMAGIRVIDLRRNRVKTNNVCDFFKELINAYPETIIYMNTYQQIFVYFVIDALVETHPHLKQHVTYVKKTHTLPCGAKNTYYWHDPCISRNGNLIGPLIIMHINVPINVPKNIT